MKNQIKKKAKNKSKNKNKGKLKKFTTKPLKSTINNKVVNKKGVIVKTIRKKKDKNKDKQKKKIKARKETDIQKVINHYFKTKGLSLEEIKKSAKKKKIIYSRYVRPAKQLLELAGSLPQAKSAITKVANWANSRKLDYAIETVFKKWLEMDRLKPKEVVKKPFYQGNSMVWSQAKKQWYVVLEDGEWREFAGDEKEIKWKVVKK